MSRQARSPCPDARPSRGGDHSASRRSSTDAFTNRASCGARLK
ncbi:MULTISPECIES: hypothetical protein [unclassified Streptomyces]|nr:MULTISPECIES: hypothetical protein [unclassified Streptomyces]